MQSSYFSAQKPGKTQGHHLLPAFLCYLILIGVMLLYHIYHPYHLFLDRLTTWRSVMNFCYCITNYQKCSRLKQHTTIITLFLWIRNRHDLTDSSAQHLTRLKRRFSWTVFSSGGSTGEGPTSKLP